VQDGQQRDGHRAAEVKHGAGLGEDPVGVAQVRVDVLGGAARLAGQERPRVRQHDRVIVHVDDPGLGRDRLGDLMGVARCRDASANIEELADPRLPGQEANGPPEEGPVGPAAGGEARVDLEPGLHRLAVGRVVVLAAEQVVIHPGLVGHGGVEGQ